MAIYTARVVNGRGRGAELGIPTLNLVIPRDFYYEHGVYAGWVYVDSRKYMGAFHFGPVPVFNERKPSLEALIIGEYLKTRPAEVSFEFIKRVRDVRSFRNTDELVGQVTTDVEQIQAILRLP